MKSNSHFEWVSTIRAGFPVETLGSLSSQTGVTNTEIATLLGISVRKLTQRKRTGAFSCGESEKLLRVASAIAQAEDVFDDLENALDWLRSPVIVLGGATPFSLLDTEVGGEIVMNTLGRIAYGIPA